MLIEPASACLDGTVNVISVAKGCIFNAIGHTVHAMLDFTNATMHLTCFDA